MRRIWRVARNKYIGFMKRSGFVRPTQVVLEATNRCNLNCPFCLVGRQNALVPKHGNTSHDLMSRSLGAMSLETFEMARRQMKDFGIKKVYLHFQGEPFLNKLTPRFAAALKQDGFFVAVFTNGQIFTDAMIADIAAVEIDLIRFSVDGASEETYQKNRVGGTFAKVHENMVKMVKAHSGKRTRVEWQFLALRNNEHEIETARKMGESMGINFFVKKFRVTDPDMAPLDSQYHSVLQKKPCSDIYETMGIYWNGDVVPCCYDVDGAEVMGSISVMPLLQIWNNTKYREFRRRVEAYRDDPSLDPELCRGCLRWR